MALKERTVFATVQELKQGTLAHANKCNIFVVSKAPRLYTCSSSCTTASETST